MFPAHFMEAERSPEEAECVWLQQKQPGTSHLPAASLAGCQRKPGIHSILSDALNTPVGTDRAWHIHSFNTRLCAGEESNKPVDSLCLRSGLPSS